MLPSYSSWKFATLWIPNINLMYSPTKIGREFWVWLATEFQWCEQKNIYIVIIIKFKVNSSNFYFSCHLFYPNIENFYLHWFLLMWTQCNVINVMLLWLFSIVLIWNYNLFKENVIFLFDCSHFLATYLKNVWFVRFPI